MPIDLTTLALVAGLFFGAVIGDAALFGDPLRLQISVPTRLADGGFTEEAAEQIFANEVARIGEVLSIVPTPSVQVSSSPSVFAAIAKPLNLEDLVVTLQQQVGRDVVQIHGQVMDAPQGKGLEMTVTAMSPRELPISLRLQQPDGDAVTLVERASKELLAQVSPYRVALTDFAALVRGDPSAMARVRQMANAALAHPWTRTRATERLMLHNLLGVTAMLEGDLTAAETEFGLGLQTPGAAPAAVGTIALNRAFLALAQRRPADALADYKEALAKTSDVRLPGYNSRLFCMAALITWAQGDTAKAEALLQQAIALAPDNRMAYVYLGRLLAQRGDSLGADAMKAAAATTPRFELDFPALAMSELWVDPVKGGLERRSD
ncbi:MAG: tetratricopeptide repeat protein [Dongiaceae bacterium]